MSWIPPVNGRVSAIKSQFENLNTNNNNGNNNNLNLELLDISNNNKKIKTSPLQSKINNFQFQRSATSHELINKNYRSRKITEDFININQNRKDSLNVSIDSLLEEKKRKTNDVPMITSSATAASSASTEHSFDNAAKENKTKNDVKLSRHTSDPVKRSSIKRSPAFRFGDKQQINKTVLIKQQQHQLCTSSGINKQNFSDKKLENFILKKCENIEKLQQPGLTDSMKAALRQPLPNGPPPKKPPRIFSSNNNSNDSNSNKSFDLQIQQKSIEKISEEKRHENDLLLSQINDKNLTETNLKLRQREQNKEIKNKIKFLENNLIIKNNDNVSSSTSTTTAAAIPSISSSSSVQLHKTIKQTPKVLMTRSKTELNLVHKGGLKFLDLITCHKNISQQIYNDTNNLNQIDCESSSSSTISSLSLSNSNNDFDDDKKPLINRNNNSNNNDNKDISETENDFIDKRNSTEPIYMEPFGHLKFPSFFTGHSQQQHIHHHHHHHHYIRQQNVIDEEDTENIFENDDNSLTNSNLSHICNCLDNHQKGDLHYLCTTIDDNITELDNSEKDAGNLSGKAYNEISILVNAAFQHENFESDDSNATCSTLNEAIATTSTTSTTNIPNDTDNQTIDKKISTKLCRSLTEKRKDYVRRIASVIPEKKLSTYGTLHKTFKTPIIKAFTNFNEQNLINNDCNNDNVNEIDKIKVKNFLALENENSNNTDNNNDGDGDDKDEIDCVMTTNERINKYNKLIEENCNNSDNDKNMIKSYNTNNNKINKDITNNTNNNMNDHQYKKNDCNSKKKVKISQSQQQIQKLFQVCILVGYNVSNNCAYIKSQYPKNEPIPDNIEQLIFPSDNLLRIGRENQEYCLILTDDNGFKVYGYCRRVLPEKSEMCLPLCYCLISVTKSFGFFQKILKEIETRHGQSDIQMNQLLKLLQNSQIPNAGKFLHIKLPLQNQPKMIITSSVMPSSSSNYKISPKRLNLESNPKWLTESAAQSVMQIVEDSNPVKINKKSFGNQSKSLVKDFEDKKQRQQQQNNHPPFDLELINRSLIVRDPNYDEILIRRPNDLRLENTELSELINCLGSELLINIFATLLLERKVILKCSNITLLSKSIFALQSILYPFQWQYTIVTILPKHLIEICQAPFPILVGILNDNNIDDNLTDIEDGIIVNLNSKKFEKHCGDEHTILPEQLRESLHLSLEMVDLIDKGKMLSNVLISEAFLRFFIELFSNYNDNKFYKEKFIQSHQSENIKYFLEWFIETSMFRNFCNDKYINYNNLYSHGNRNNNNNNNDNNNINDINICTNTSTDFYTLFDARLVEKSQNNTNSNNDNNIISNCNKKITSTTTKTNIHNIEAIVKNSKIINKKSKTFKERFKQFLNN